MSHQFIIKLILAFAFLTAWTTYSSAQLSGEVDLGGSPAQSDTANETNIKEITVTGIGTTLETAEKQALAAAIRQAVGAYIDSKTLVENEEVIQDRILAVSNAFVEGYETIGQPKKSADGLVEITIVAKVKTNQIVQKLKEVNLISGDVAGHNIYAEATTKVMNAQDAVAMLQAKVPELIKSCVTITPLDKDGNPMLVKDPGGKLVPSTAPAITEENAETGEVTLTWLLEIGLDKKYYRETLFPLVKECMDAIAGTPAKPANRKLETIRGNLSYTNGWEMIPFKYRIVNWVESLSKFPETTVLFHSFSRNFDTCDYFYYEEPKATLKMLYKKDNGDKTSDGTVVSLKALAPNGDLIAATNSYCWQPFMARPADYDGRFVGIGPNVKADPLGSIWFTHPISVLRLTLPISDTKEIKEVQIALDVLEPVFTLESSQN